MDSHMDFPRDIKRILSFNTDSIEPGIEIVDHVERDKCYIETADNVRIQEITTEEFYFPVDRGISISTKNIAIPHPSIVFIRDDIGNLLNEVNKGETKSFPFDKYILGFTAPVKLYIVVEAAFDITVTSEIVKLQFNNITEIKIGARSHHERPAASIEITEDIGEMMQAVSYLSSSLKTTSSERSYPTLRGHPPVIRLSDEFNVPAFLEKPDTGIKIEIPPRKSSLFVVSPLAFYLAADVVCGQEHIIKTNDGFEYSLEDPDHGFEIETSQILKKCFLLDCITRTGGYYPVNINEQQIIEDNISINVNDLYRKSVSEQLKRYLKIPYEKVKTAIPTWKTAAIMDIEPSYVSYLPYIINELGMIRTSEAASKNNKSKHGDNIGKVDKKHSNNFENFLRNNSGTESGERDICIDDNLIYRSGEEYEDPAKYVNIGKFDAQETTWIGNRFAIDASKAMLESYQNRLTRDPIEGNIEISVVINDNEMVGEGNFADEIYSSREKLSFNVNVYEELSKIKLREVLKSNVDFLHYVGHIDKSGFECIDGRLDVTELEYAGIDAFLLNACSSYKQASALIKAGAISGIATVRPIINSGAERVGKTLSRLLNLGYPLTPALQIAKTQSIMGENYIVIGDGGVSLAQPKSGIPSYCEIHRMNDEYLVNYKTYLTKKRGIGTITKPFVQNNEKYFLASGKTGEFRMSLDEIIEFLSLGEFPLKYDDGLYWSNENEIIGVL